MSAVSLGPRPAIAILALILLSGAALRMINFTAAFEGPHEADSVMFALAARNHLRMGLTETMGAMYVLPAGPGPERPGFYTNHPGTLSLLVAAVFHLFGESEAAARLVPIAFSLLGIFLLYASVRRRWGLAAALLAAFLHASLPIAAYYGRVVAFLGVILPFGILIADRHGREDPPSPRRNLIDFALMAAAASVDYGAFFILPALAIAYGFRRRLLPLTLACVVTGLLHFAQVAAIHGPEGLGLLLQKALSRGGAGASFSLSEFFIRQASDYFLFAFTPIASAAALFGFASLDRSRSERNRFVLSLLLWGLLYIGVFREAAHVHDYWQYYLIPSVAILVAIAIIRLPRLVAIAALLLLFDQSLRILTRHYHADRWYGLEFRAVEFARGHPEARLIICREPLRTLHLTYYADRSFRVDPDLPVEFAEGRSSP